MPPANITDPVEIVIANALSSRGIDFIHDSQGGTRNLDFYLPDSGVYIECKRFHSDRITEQMVRVDNIIAIQGMAAAEFFLQHFGAEP